MINTIRDRFDEEIYPVVGGFHLKGQEEDYINKTVDWLKANTEK